MSSRSCGYRLLRQASLSETENNLPQPAPVRSFHFGQAKELIYDHFGAREPRFVERVHTPADVRDSLLVAQVSDLELHFAKPAFDASQFWRQCKVSDVIGCK